ncbi:alpha/beta hydrolase family protein [Mahella australiensis]|uniref:Peptidase S9 prolyl oligopeptidase catalytic domain-containing protein n=1 Tax=Mahella australiensis (strain DSM 15567 / CIP 107919 / 50-1 BON) TaxID=697281 RepID=F4A256_MAHA5|nr:alpha/beta fold hydrolase [Mahella australiensis]AEE97195.1 hypothetical protein Mahau_2019 [Mahella australiensis 50-1 BON]
MKVTINPGKRNDITFLEISTDDRRNNKPMVIIIHGWSARKENMLFPAYFLAQSGFFVIAPDAYGHGERKTDALKEPLSILMNAIAITADDINTLIDNYTDDDRVDTTRVGLAGVSMGGIITYSYIVKKDRKVKAAVSLISTPDISAALDSSSKEALFKMAGIDLHDDDSKAKEILKIAEAIQPAKHYQDINGLPLLILNGTADPLIDIENVRKFYNFMKPIYYDAEAIQMIEYPDVGHAVNFNMVQDMAQWFETYL